MKSYVAGLIAVLVLLAGCDDQSEQPKPPVMPGKPKVANPQPGPAASGPQAASGAQATGAPSATLQIGEFGMPVITKEEDLNCFACHRITTREVGPPWQEVSAKYKNAKTYKYSPDGSNAPDAKEYPLVEGLVMKVSRGGHGNWGTMPMPANDPGGKKKERIESLVRFILGLAK
jgi:cytochrome c551/c552